jgi:hypothetical protein
MIFFRSEVIWTYKSPNIKSNSDICHAKKLKLVNSSRKLANFYINAILKTI